VRQGLPPTAPSLIGTLRPNQQGSFFLVAHKTTLPQLAAGQALSVQTGGKHGHEEDRKFLLRKAKDWTKLPIMMELEIRAAAKEVALVGRRLWAATLPVSLSTNLPSHPASGPPQSRMVFVVDIVPRLNVH
jgi:hypothetical protein